jgi:hypothetical protein
MNDLTIQLHLYFTLQNGHRNAVKDKENRRMFKKKKKEQESIKFDKKTNRKN